MARMPGWQETLEEAIPDSEYISKTIKELPIEVRRKFLTYWETEVPFNEQLINSKFLDCAATQVLLNNCSITSFEKLNAGALKVETPEWLVKLRKAAITEGDIRIIISRLGIKPEVIAMATIDTLKTLKVSPPTKEIIKDFISAWNGFQESSFTLIQERRENNLLPGLMSPQHSRSRPNSNRPSRRQSVQEQVNALGDILESTHLNQRERVVYVGKTNIKLPKYEIGTDPWYWLRAVKRQLTLEDCSDLDKLRCLKKSMTDVFLDASEQIDATQLNLSWQQYINELEKALMSPAELAKAQSELMALRYYPTMDPVVFIRQLKLLLEKVKGKVDEQDVIMDLLQRLPPYIRDHIFAVRANNSISDIVTTLIHSYYGKRNDRKLQERKPQSASPSEIKVKSEGERKSPTPTSTPQTTWRDPTCYNCQEKGHLSRDCPKPQRPKTPPINSQGKREVKISNYLELIPDSEKPEEDKEEEEEPTSEVQYLFSNFITQKVTGRNFPAVETTLCYPNCSVYKTGKVMIDTGADVSVIDHQLAQQLKAYIVPTTVTIKGIGGLEPAIIGETYCYFKHKEMNTVKALKILVIKDLEPILLLGHRFSEIFNMILVNNGGKYCVALREQETSKPLKAEVLMRFATQKESTHLSSLPDAQQLVTNLDINKNDLTELLTILPGSPYKENEMTKKANEIPKEVTFLLENENCQVIKFDKLVFIYLVETTSLEDRLMARMDVKLSTIMKKELLTILLDYSDVFSKFKGDLGFVPWTKWPIKIDIGDNHVPYQKPYPCTIQMRQAYQQVIKDLLDMDIIEPSLAEGGSPALLIGKPDGSFRLLNDLRAINRMSKVIYHPMPRIDDCLEAARGAKYFNMLDLYQGYFQIEIPPDERKKTVFVTPDAKYHYKRLPMGLACAPFEFQRMMNKVLEGLSFSECIGYFDDVPIIGKSWNSLLDNTRMVLNRLREWNLKVKTDKCSFGVTELLLLGHLVDGTGIRPDPNKVKVLLDLPYPKSVKQLQSQLGTFNYFSRYISNYSKLASPLYRLVSKERKFKMIRQDFEALDKLKKALVETTLLVHFDPLLKKKLAVDASDVAVGGILMQEDPKYSQGETVIEKILHWLPVSFFSQKISSHQESYTISEKELLAILIGIKKFRHYLEGDEFLVETDHHALCQLPKITFKNQRLNRWAIMLSPFNYQVIYKKGSTHPADCFSRFSNEWKHRKFINPIDPEKDYLEHLYAIWKEQKEDEANELNFSAMKQVKKKKSFVFFFKTTSDWKQELLKLQQEDKDINNKIIELTVNPHSSSNHHYVLREGLLYRKPAYSNQFHRIVINQKLLKRLFDDEHNNYGHFGHEKTYLAISRRFWMPLMFEEVKRLCKNCVICMKAKPANCTYADPQLKPIPDHVLDRIELDAQGPITFQNGARKIILVIVDTFTRFVFARVYPNQITKTVISFLNEYFSIFDLPKVIQTDRGRNFVSEELSQYLSNLGIKHEISSPYHPQSQGVVERTNRNIGERLRSSILENGLTNLDECVKKSLLTINTSVHKIHRFSPYFLLFGREPNRAIDNHLNLVFDFDNNSINKARKLAKARLLSQQHYYRNKLKEITKPNPYTIGEFCFVNNSAPSLGTSKKLVEKYHGPYMIIGIRKGSLLLFDCDNYDVFISNIQLTKPYQGELTDQLKKLRENYFNSSSDNWLSNDIEVNESNNLIGSDKVSEQPDDEIIPEQVNLDPPINELDKSESEEIDKTIQQGEQLKKRRTYQTANRQIVNSKNIIDDTTKRTTRQQKVLLIYFNFAAECKHKKQLKQLKEGDTKGHVVKTTAILTPLIVQLSGQSVVSFVLYKKLFHCFNFIRYTLISKVKINYRTSIMSGNNTKIESIDDWETMSIESFIRLPRVIPSNFHSHNHKPDLNASWNNYVDPEKIEELNDLTTLWTKLKLKDPLAYSTANACRSLPKSTSADESPYPPPHPITLDQGLIPAPLPTRDEDKPKYLQVKFYQKAKSEVKKQLEEAKLVFVNFQNFIKEKIELNVLNVKEIDYDNLNKGLPRSKVIHPCLNNYINKLICALCEQISIPPRRCENCQQLYCLDCGNWLTKLINQVGMSEPKEPNQFICIKESCIVLTARTKIYPVFGPVNNVELFKFYESAKFQCPRKYCSDFLSIEHYYSHSKRCLNGPIDFTMDKDLKLNYLIGPARNVINSQPTSLANLLPSHLKLKEKDKTHEEVWQEKALTYAYLVSMYETDPNIKPTQLRAHINLNLNYWNNYELSSDPTTPKNEGESFLQEIGFPSCSKEQGFNIQPAASRYPMTKWLNKDKGLPSYLLSSTNWQRFLLNVTEEADSIDSTNSSYILYSEDIEDPDSPFIRIDPYSRLAPAEVENVIQILTEHFPSCINPKSIYGPPKTSTKFSTIAANDRRRRQLKYFFDNRPQANIPPMQQGQIDIINKTKELIPDKSTIYSINMFFVRINEGGKLRPRPCWICLVDGNLEVVYETFVKYHEVDKLDINYHGLSMPALKHARTLNVVRDQVLRYLVTASKIVGHGIINQLYALGLHSREINYLLDKMREINNIYSPYRQSPMNLHSIAYFWFMGYTLPAKIHSPVVEAITTMRLYILTWQKIEARATFLEDGIHHENAINTCGNSITSTILYVFDSLRIQGKVRWPEEWKRDSKYSKLPQWDNENCVPIIKELAELLFKVSSPTHIDQKSITKDSREPTVYFNNFAIDLLPNPYYLQPSNFEQFNFEGGLGHRPGDMKGRV